MESLPNLPEEVMVDIFSRLPAKSVGRCRCLSKPWRVLLSQPHFTQTHLNQTINLRKPTLLLVADAHNYLCSPVFNNAHQLFDEITIPTTTLSFAAYPNSLFDYYGSCNGLVLAIDLDKNKFVLNPITREIRHLPDFPFVLALDGTIEMYGFGYDSVNGDYMVVQLSRYHTEYGYGDHSHHEMLASVYSMKSNTWEEVEISPYYCHCRASGVYLNGGIHWVGEVEKSEDSVEFVVVVFDTNEKKFKEMQTPNTFSHPMVYTTFLVVLDGCLCVYTDDASGFWVMKEYGVHESWTNFTINNPPVYFCDVKVLCMLGQEEIVLSNEFGTKTVMMYNLKQGTFKDIVFHGVPDNIIYLKSFVEICISPHTLH